MALPALKSLEECGDFAHALEPVLVPQLLALPSRLLTAATASVNSTSPEPLLRLYVETNPFVTGLAATLVSTVVFLIVSEINKNYSQVDRCWSIFPTLFNLHYAIWARLAGIPSRRVDAVLLWSTAWSVCDDQWDV